MVVIKIGGSLYNSPHLKEWLDVLAQQVSQSIIIVPGGGPFAEQVRVVDQQRSLSSDTSHAMAILAMQQYAHMLHDIQRSLSFVSDLAEMQTPASNKQAYLWLPYNEVIATDELQRDWQTTSDSIALWLAIKLQAQRLVLVKSAPVSNKVQSELLNSDIVDKNFQSMLSRYVGRLEFMHASEATTLMDRLTT